MQQKLWGGGFSKQPAHGKGHPLRLLHPPPKTPARSLAPLHACPPHPGVPEPGLDPRVLPGAGLGGAVGAPPLLPTPNPKASSPGDLALRCPTEPCRGWGRDLQLPWASPPGMLCPHIDASPPSVCLHGLKHLFGAGGGKGGTAFAALTRVSPHACASRVGGAGPGAPPFPFYRTPWGPQDGLCPGTRPVPWCPPPNTGGSGLPQLLGDPRHPFFVPVGSALAPESPRVCVWGWGAQS